MTAALRQRLGREAGRRGIGFSDWVVLKLALDADRGAALAAPAEFATVARWRSRC